MLYFHYFMVGAWMFAIGWFFGAVYMQNQNENKETPRAVEKLEPCMECDALRLPVAASAAAD
jgi:hypothetical protein